MSSNSLLEKNAISNAVSDAITSDIASVSSKEFLEIQATIEVDSL